MNVLRPICTRWRAIRHYAAAAPMVAGLHRWLVLGAIRCRLFGGQGYLRPALRRHARDFRLPIGKLDECVVVDMTSPFELDSLDEVLVNKIYPLDRVGLVPVMILDCGANVGYFASLARVKFPKAKIVCWEPNDHNYSRLLLQPLLKSSEVICLNAAISDIDGWANLIGDGAGCTIEVENAQGGQRIETVNLPLWMDRNVRSPLLIKMDIEGHERRVLRALRGHWISPCVLFLETHAENGDDAEIMNDLASAGFSIECLRTHFLGQDTRIFKEYMCRRPYEIQ